METAAVSYKLIKKVKDDKFNVDHLQHYSLLLQIGVRDFQVCIIDTRENRCLLLEDYVMASIKSHSALIEVLTKLFEEHHLLMAGFWKSVKFSFKNNKFSLVPAPLFVKEALYDYIRLNAEVNTDTEELLYYKNIKSNVVTVFAVNKMLLSWIKKVYPTLEVGFVHQSCTLIEGLLATNTNYSKDTMYVYIDRFKLHVITLNNGQLEYYNQFPIKQFSDYVKFIMLVMKGLQLDQNSSNVMLWGYIGKQSPHYVEFHKFIRNISFGDRPDYIKFSYAFDEAQDHHFFDLYSIYPCD